MRIEDIKLLYSKRYSTQHGEAQGSSERDIRDLEKTLQARLPKTYREYLRWMGNDRYGRLAGSDWFIGNIVENNKFLPSFLLENGLNLEGFDQPLCFFVHQGYMAAWFDLATAKDDPDCYFFFEGSGSNKIEGPVTFTSFLANDLGFEKQDVRY